VNIIQNISKKALIYIITIGAVLMGFSEEGYARGHSSSSSYKKTNRQAPYYLSNKSHKHHSYRSFFSFIFPFRYSQPKVKFIKPWKKTTISTKSDQVFLPKFTGRNLDYDTFVFSVNGEDRSSELARFWTFSGGKLKFDDGKYIVKAKIADKLGRYSKTEKRKLLIDSTAPEVIFADGPGDQVLQEPVYKLDVILKDELVGLKNNSIRIFLNGKDITKKLRRSRSLARISKLERRIVADLEIDSSRENFVLIKVSDKLGNQAEVSKRIVIEPILVLSSLIPAEGQSLINSTGQILISGDSNLPLSSISVNGVPGTITAGGLKFEALLPVSASGTQSVGINAQTASGQSKNISYAFDVLFDNASPVVSADISSGVITSSKAFSFNLSVEDENSTVTKVMLNGVDILQSAEKNFLVEAELAEGLNNFEINSTDVAGNVSEVLKIVNIDLDTVPIILSNQVPQESSVVLSSTGRIQVSGVSSRKLKSLKVNGVEMSVSLDGLSYQGEVSFSTGGTQKLNIVAENEKGLITESSYLFELNLDNIAPVVALQGVQNTTTDNKAYGFSVSIIDSNDTVTEIFQNGSLIATRSEKSFFISAVLVEGSNSFSVVSRDILNNTSETRSLTGIVLDTVPTVLTFDSPKENEELVTNSTTATVIGSSNRVLSSLVINGTQAAILNNGLAYSGQIEVMESGVKTITLVAENEFGKKTTISYSVNVVFDNASPELTIAANENFSTNQSAYSFQIIVEDENSVETRVLQNGNLISTTTNKNELIHVVLEQGVNSFEVVSEDVAGNLSDTKTIGGVTLDTVMPFITWDTPQNGEEISDFDIHIMGTSNEDISEATINGMQLAVGVDQLTFTGKYTPMTIGEQSLELVVKDLVGNSYTETRTVTTLYKIINFDLIDIQLSSSEDGLTVSGGKMSTRPLTSISIEVNGSTLSTESDNEGKFSIDTEFFEIARITASFEGEEVSQDLNYKIETKLSGILLDPSNNPIPGVTLTIVKDERDPDQVLRAITDQGGAFVFTDAPLGRQTVIIDATGIDEDVTGTDKKFSVKTINVNIRFAVRNVLKSPIYLAPIILDGTETKIVNSGAATVSSPNAPGLILEIPEGSVRFPDGTDSGSISLSVAPSDRVIVPPPEFAKPEKVYNLEPSGTSFTKDVKVTLPNDNNFPEGVELVILSMNSASGSWEIDGLAQVDSGGGSISTLPGKGITHFSEIYAVPIMPVMENLSKSKETGINVANGASSSMIDLPSFKSLGSNYKMSLNYNSSWAKPTAFISNYFSIPEQRLEYNTVNSTTEEIRFEVKTKKYCLGIRCGSTTRELNDFITRESITNIESWYVPESVSFNFYVNGIKSKEGIVLGDPESKTLFGETLEYTSIPHQSQISYAFELIDPETKDYFDSGIYTAFSRFKVKMNNLVFQSYGVSLTSARADEVLDSNNKAYADLFSQIFETDLKQNIIVNNKTKSSYGAGWDIQNTKEILNPDATRIVLDEGGGVHSLYSQNNIIETALDGDVIDVDLKQGMSFNNYPEFYAVRDFFGARTQVMKGEFGSNSVSLIKTLNPYSGTLFTENPNCNNFCNKTDANGFEDCSGTTRSSSFPYGYKPTLSKLAVGPDYIYSIGEDNSSLFAISTSEHINLNIQKPSKDLTDVGAVEYCKQLGTQCFNTFGSTQMACPRLRFSSPSPSDRTDGEVGASSAKVSRPKDIISGNNGKLYYSSGDDTAGKIITFNSRFNIGSLSSGNIVFDGTSNNPDLPYKPILANGKAYGFTKPNGMVMDSQNRLYISMANGLILRLDDLNPDTRTPSDIVHIAGKPLADGGALSDSIDSKSMYFNDPLGMEVDEENGFLYVSDTGNHRVVRIDLNGSKSETIAGSGECTLDKIGDGGASANASLCSPTYLHLDEGKNLLIVDSGHNRVRKVSFNFDSNAPAVFLSDKRDLSTLTKFADGSFERKLRNETTELYSANGKITLEKDLQNRSLVYEYNSEGDLSKIIDPVGQVVEMRYSSGLLDSITDPAGRQTFFRYSGKQLTNVLFPDGSEKDYTYFEDGLLKDEIGKNGFKKTYSYNAYNRIENITLEDGSEVKIADNVSKTIENDSSSPVLSSYNPAEDNKTTTIGNGDADLYSFDYDIDGYVVKSTDALGRVTETYRNNNGDPIEMIRPDGGKILFEYDPVTSDISKETFISSSGREFTRHRTYDALGNLVRSETSTGVISTKQIDLSTGQLLSQVTDEGVETSYKYNTLGLIIEATSSVDNSADIVRTFAHDSLGRITSLREGSEEKIFINDSAGNVIEERVKNGEGDFRSTFYTYDGFNRLKTVTNAENEETSYSYTESGRISAIESAKGDLTKFTYDSRNRLIGKLYPNGQTWVYTYDSNNNVIQVVQPDGSIKNLKYDVANRLVKKELADDVYDYTYNGLDNMTQITNKNSSINFSFDDRGNMTQENVSGSGQMIGYGSHSKSYGFNDRGQLSSYGDSFGYSNASYSYSANQKLTSIVHEKFGSIAFGYDNFGRLSQVSNRAIDTSFTFDEGSLLKKIVHARGGGQRAFFDYTMSSSGQVRGIASNSGVETFNYSSNNYLISASHPQSTHKIGSDPSTDFSSEAFSHDKLGNRLADSLGTYEYDENGYALKENYKFRYLYDLKGNLVSKENKISGEFVKYEYGVENQLDKVVYLTSAISSTPTKEVAYFYDALGRRMHKSVTEGVSTKIRNYIYDKDEVAGEFDESGQLLARYLHSGLKTDDILGVHYTAAGVSKGLAKASGDYFYLKDHIGTVKHVVDSNGSVVQNINYSAYGMITSITDGVGTLITNDPKVQVYHSFTGREYDNETKMYYYRARYYDPSSGRFIQHDPHPGKLRLPLSVTNKYTYAGNNPLMYRDPAGLNFFDDLFDFVFVGAAAIMNLVVGIFTLDIARIISGVALALEFVLAPLNLLFNGKLPKYSDFKGMGVVKNSFLSSLDSAPGFSLGPVTFISPNDDKEDELNIIRHEYGHYLQYQKWGGWKFIFEGVKNKGKGDSDLESGADEIACDLFPGFVPNYGGKCSDF